jgi:hypothetical protein
MTRCVRFGTHSPGFAECYPPSLNASKYLHVRISDSIHGPWSDPANLSISGMPDSVLKIAAHATDNASPLVIVDPSLPSGYRILLAFRYPGNDSWCGDHRCANSALGLAEATQWNGTYRSIGNLTNPAVGTAFPYLGWEDPTLFSGANGSLHLLAHKYSNGRAAPGWPGVHAFSADKGRTWAVSKQHDGRGAYSYEVEWEGGSIEGNHPHRHGDRTAGVPKSTKFSRRERPELRMDPAGTGSPLFLASGVQYESSNGASDDGPGNDHRYSFVVVQRARTM